MGRPLYSYGPSCYPGSCSCSECAFSQRHQTSSDGMAVEVGQRMPDISAHPHNRVGPLRRTYAVRQQAPVPTNPSATTVSLPSLSTALQAEDGLVARHISTETRTLPLSRTTQANEEGTTLTSGGVPASIPEVTSTSVSRSAMNDRPRPLLPPLDAIVSDHSTMIPARLSTPVPTLEPSRGNDAPSNRRTSIASALTSLDTWLDSRNSRSSERRSMRIGESPWAFRSVSSNTTRNAHPASYDEGLARAQTAIENSRQALSQARDAIRNALLHSERLERVAAILRREVEGSAVARSSASSANANLLDSEPITFNLERSLAELRQASAEIDRVLQEANGPADRPEQPSLTRHLMSISRASANRNAGSATTRPQSSSLGSASLPPMSASTIAHPIPLRPGALGSRSGGASFPAASWPDRVVTDRSLPLGRVAGETAAVASEPSNGLHEQLDQCLEESSSLPSLRRRPRGGWRRLDANADEIDDDQQEDGALSHSSAQSGMRNAGFGWRWTPASLIEGDDKAWLRTSQGPRSDDLTGLLLDEQRRNQSSRRWRFDGNREMVGR